MKFELGQIYHIYNQGNNNNKTFYTNENYLFFLRKMKKYLQPNCHILAYCLMDNHFHLLVTPTEFGIENYNSNSSILKSNLSWGIANLLSSYTKAINVQEGRTGSLWRRDTKKKLVSSSSLLEDYAAWCFVYIHQNPVVAGMVDSAEQWMYSSFQDYLGMRNGTMCNQVLAQELLKIRENELLLRSILPQEFNLDL